MGVCSAAFPRDNAARLLNLNAEARIPFFERRAQLVIQYLGADLKQQVDKPEKTPSSAELMKRAEEIEKLAKSVKERMKG